MLHGADTDNSMTHRIIGCALAVHRELGPGLLEAVYESALCVEMKATGVEFRRQVGVPLYYRGELIAEHRIDLLVANRIVVEVKTVESINPIHIAQVLTYLRVIDARVGLLLNFKTAVLKHGITRVIR